MHKYEIDNKKSEGSSTVIYTVVLDVPTIKAQYDVSFKKLASTLKVAGFREGKAPPKVAEKQIDESKVYDDVLRTLLEATVQDLVKKNELRPIVSPKVDIVSAKKDDPWKLTITIASKPAIDISTHKKLIAQVKGDQKKDDIWVPGKSKDGEDASKSEQKKQALLNAILQKFLKELSVEVPKLVIETELQKRLTKLIDDVAKVGLTIEQYLESKNETLDALKEKITKETRDTYALEFILEEIADSEKISVTADDLSTFFNEIKDETQKQNAQKNAYLYASLLRRQKTLDYLLSAQ